MKTTSSLGHVSKKQMYRLGNGAVMEDTDFLKPFRIFRQFTLKIRYFLSVLIEHFYRFSSKFIGISRDTPEIDERWFNDS